MSKPSNPADAGGPPGWLLSLYTVAAIAGLVLASSTQWIFHAIVSAVLLYRVLGGMPLNHLCEC